MDKSAHLLGKSSKKSNKKRRNELCQLKSVMHQKMKTTHIQMEKQEIKQKKKFAHVNGILNLGNLYLDLQVVQLQKKWQKLVKQVVQITRLVMTKTKEIL